MSLVLLFRQKDEKVNYFPKNTNPKCTLFMVRLLFKNEMNFGMLIRFLLGMAVDDFPNYFNFLGPNSLSFEASVVEEMELQSEYITQIASYLYKKNVGSFRYAVMANEERLRTWTLSLRAGQAKHPAAVPTCKSYYKVSPSNLKLPVNEY
jgi:hypothetical protein